MEFCRSLPSPVSINHRDACYNIIIIGRLVYRNGIYFIIYRFSRIGVPVPKNNDTHKPCTIV